MPGMEPQDVYALTGGADPRLSPDGGTVAFTVWRVDRDRNTYPSAIWLAAVDGSSQPRPFTSGDHRDGSPRWSPDGRMLAFTSAREEKKPPQLFVIPVGGGEAQRLTDLPEGVGEPAWSPDGTTIAFTARVRDAAYDEEDPRRRRPRRITRLNYKLDDEGWTVDRRRHLFTVPADGSSDPVQLTHGDFEDHGPAWSPDGRLLAFVSARHDDWDIEPASDVFLLEPGGEPERLTDTNGFYDAPSWSPDGTRIACRWSPYDGSDPWHARIAVIDVQTRAVRILTDGFDRNCGPYPAVREPVWAGDDLLFAIEDRGNTSLYRVPADGSRAPEAVLDGERCVTGFDASGDVLVHTATTVTSLPELFVGERRVTSVGERFAAERTLTDAERFTAVSRDGSAVDAWIMRPPDMREGERYPMLLNIHGGPFTQYGNRFFDEFHVYAGAGYVVLFSNPRGSSGYSEAWGRAIRGPAADAGPGWGSVDYEDLTAVVDTALERYDFIDRERLGVLGGSYGGYMTSWIIGHTDRFAAACSERALNDAYSFFGSSDVGAFIRDIVGAHPWDEPEAYARISPTTFAERIRTPLLIMHAEDDLRCAVEQAEQLFVRLRMLRRPVEFVRFPDESHELSRSGSPAHRVMRFETILEWFARHLHVDDPTASRS